MLIDAAHTEETRVAIVDGEKLDKYDFEVLSKAQVKGNIYLAKIIRVEPSLQAAFVDYGGDRHGFLSFSEIHHDYFQIPVGDREELEKHIENAIAAKVAENGDDIEEIDPKEISKLRYQFHKRYKIQEVIKKRQIMLVQVTKEERGNKGAALTTYISLAGRYCVLMPNTNKGNGVSRKITNHNDRVKLKEVVSSLHVENGSVVIRTAGVGHTKMEMKKDFDYLTKLWNEIRETTLQSTAPCIIHEEANLIKRAIRDLYTREIESIIVEGDEGYKAAKKFIKKLIPSHSKKVKLYEDPKLPLFNKYKINDQINQIYSTRVDLPSGGYLIINTTEALISIDVNSGKATRERNIEETAVKTNLEAAAEVARQCRLRDLAGLVVVDFIDMDEKRDNLLIERALKEALHDDKAKIQVGSISSFGLLEFSRQRLRSSIADANMIPCPHCSGTGVIWSNEAIALQILRRIEESCAAFELTEITVTLATDLALYLLNNKRSFISNIEERLGCNVMFKTDSTLAFSDFKLEPELKEEKLEENKKDSDSNSKRRKAKRTIIGKKQRNIPIDDEDTEVENIEDTEIIESNDFEEVSDKASQETSQNPASKTSNVYGTRKKRNFLPKETEEKTNSPEASSEDEMPVVLDIETKTKKANKKKNAKKKVEAESVLDTNDEPKEALPALSEDKETAKKFTKKRKKPKNDDAQANDYKSIKVDFSPSLNIKDKRDALSKFAESYVVYEFYGKDADPQAMALNNEERKGGWWQKFLKKNASDE